MDTAQYQAKLSPPSRAAWIEINANCPLPRSVVVAAVTGGVECNNGCTGPHNATFRSPPSRAAWIEIATLRTPPQNRSVAAFTGGVDRNTAVGDYKRNVPVAAFAGGMYAALRLCDLPSLGIFLNQKQGYCILDAATLFSEKTVIGEQRYSTDNVYRLSHIAMFVKSFPLKTAGSVLPNRCPENCRQSKYDRLGSRAQLLSRKKSEFDNGFCGSCLKFAYNKIMMLCAQYYKY